MRENEADGKLLLIVREIENGPGDACGMRPACRRVGGEQIGRPDVERMAQLHECAKRHIALAALEFLIEGQRQPSAFRCLFFASSRGCGGHSGGFCRLVFDRSTWRGLLW